MTTVDNTVLLSVACVTFSAVRNDSKLPGVHNGTRLVRHWNDITLFSKHLAEIIWPAAKRKTIRHYSFSFIVIPVKTRLLCLQFLFDEVFTWHLYRTWTHGKEKLALALRSIEDSQRKLVTIWDFVWSSLLLSIYIDSSSVSSLTLQVSCLLKLV